MFITYFIAKKHSGPMMPLWRWRFSHEDQATHRTYQATKRSCCRSNIVHRGERSGLVMPLVTGQAHRPDIAGLRGHYRLKTWVFIRPDLGFLGGPSSFLRAYKYSFRPKNSNYLVFSLRNSFLFGESLNL